MSGEPWPNYGQHGGDTDDEEIRGPPTTHFVATVDDLTDMLDFDSEDIDDMDEDAGDEQHPAPTGRRTATSSHDIYMVDTPKEGNDEEIMEDGPPRSNPSADVSGAALSPAIAKTAITSQEKITLQSTPEETTTTLPRRQSMMKLQVANIVRI